MKTCYNCKTIITSADWNELDCLGVEQYAWGEETEFRQCRCGSTLRLVHRVGEPPACLYCDGTGMSHMRDTECMFCSGTGMAGGCTARVMW